MKERTPPRQSKRRFWWFLFSVAGLLLLGLAWFSYSADPKITSLRNIVHYRVVKAMGGPQVRTDEPPGAIAGAVHNTEGEPVAGSLVLVASPLGDTHTGISDADGRYHIADLPPGRYVPVAGKRGYDDALNQTCAAGLCYKHAVTVRSGTKVTGIDLTLARATLSQILVDDSLVLSPTVEVETSAPLPGEAQRTHFSFERAGLRVNDCWLYEPVTREQGVGPFPTLLLVLPGPVLGWEIVPVPFAAEGFSVLACYPLRGIDIDQDVADLLTALEYLRQGRLPSHADPERIGLVGASFSSLHTYRLLALTDQMDVTLVLGGMANGFTFRHDVETGATQARPPFDQILIALGFPHSSPELYFRYSTIFHLEGLPPVCLLHGKKDELSPFSQSVELADELDRQGIPHEFHAYEGLSHYFSTNADSVTTQQMFQDSLTCLRRFLGDQER
ncbi:MAG: carboxypeptidase regulatory-like domain-containing protein [Anaerolineae bacterium]|nr:carboxypeptidase regulatory-like domain-containing protein [Anaerolineae bacterium]